MHVVCYKTSLQKTIASPSFLDSHCRNFSFAINTCSKGHCILCVDTCTCVNRDGGKLGKTFLLHITERSMWAIH